MSNDKTFLAACIIPATGFVCGVGNDAAAAHGNAVRNMGELDDDIIAFRPCTPEFESLFRERGGDISYDDPNGVLTPLGKSASA